MQDIRFQAQLFKIACLGVQSSPIAVGVEESLEAARGRGRQGEERSFHPLEELLFALSPYLPCKKRELSVDDVHDVPPAPDKVYMIQIRRTTQYMKRRRRRFGAVWHTECAACLTRIRVRKVIKNAPSEHFLNIITPCACIAARDVLSFTAAGNASLPLD